MSRPHPLLVIRMLTSLSPAVLIYTSQTNAGRFHTSTSLPVVKIPSRFPALPVCRPQQHLSLFATGRYPGRHPRKADLARSATSQAP